MGGACPFYVLNQCLLKGDQNIVKFINEHVLVPYHLLMDLEAFFVFIEVLLMSLMLSFESLEPSFKYWVDGVTLIDRAYVLWPYGDFPTRLLKVTGLSVMLGNGDGRINLLRSWSWDWWWFFMFRQRG